MKLRLVAVMSLLVPLSAIGYWAPNHEQMNWHVFCHGRPWDEGGFKRSGSDVTDVFAYASRVLYLTDPGHCGPAPLMAPKRDPEQPPKAAPPEEGRRLRGVKYIGPKDALLPGLDLPTDEPTATLSLLDWNKRGGLWEDGFNDMDEAQAWGGRRAVNHFHDPLTGSGGYTGITSKDDGAIVPYLNLVRPGISVVSWTMNGKSGGAGGANAWGYPCIGESFFRAFTELENERREAGIAHAFRAIGQLEHLVTDNTVPDHARDLPHPGNGWEEYLAADDRMKVFHTISRPWSSFPLKLIEQGGLRAVWDRDVYNGRNPEVTFGPGSQPVGITEFVNANFYAWNRFEKWGVTKEFTTIPDRPQQGFHRFDLKLPFPDVTPATALLPLLSLRVRTSILDYPFPQWVESELPVVQSTASSLSLPIAERYKDTRELFESPAVWKDWEAPLLKHALGYAQAVVTLTLPPARMEVVPSSDGDPLKFSVRLWNLWPAGSPNAVTWHVDALQLVSVRPWKDEPLPLIDEAPITIPAGFDVAPGQVRESNPVTITWAQRSAFRYGSHAALLVTAHLGTGSTQTKLLFPVVAPNALVFVKQTSGLDVTPPFVNQPQNCDTSTCSYASENGVYRNPEHQKVMGRIELAAAEVDSVGRPADDELKAIQKADARVAGVALVGLTRQNTVEVIHPVRSTLTLTGSQLVPGGVPGAYVRVPNAPDEADGPISFEADIHLSDFYRPDMGSPLIDASRTSGSIYLAVWTTAGSVQLQRLVIWPWVDPGTAQEAVGDAFCEVQSVPHLPLVSESRGVCSHSAANTVPVCSNFTSHTRRVEFMWGDPGYARQVGANNLPDFTLALGSSNDVRVTNFAGRTVTLEGEAQAPVGCDADWLMTQWPNGNGERLCAGYAPTGLALFFTENTTSMSQCSGVPSRPALPRTASYKRIWRDDARAWIKKNLGITQLPEWTFTLQ